MDLLYHRYASPFSFIDGMILSGSVALSLRKRKNQVIYMHIQHSINCSCEASKMQVKVSEKEISAYYESALMKEPQMLINFLIREIIVFDEIHIYFNSPSQTGPDASQGFSVCDRETTIPAHIQNSYELRRKNIRLTITI